MMLVTQQRECTECHITVHLKMVKMVTFFFGYVYFTTIKILRHVLNRKFLFYFVFSLSCSVFILFRRMSRNFVLLIFLAYL